MSKKPTRKKIVASLALRVFLINFFVLVVPLLIHNLISYKTEYSIRKQDTFHQLELIAKDRVRLVETRLKSQEKILSIFQKRLQLSAANLAQENAYFKSIAKIAAATGLSYIKIINNELVCQYSSNGCLAAKQYDFLVPYIGHEVFYHIRSDPTTKNVLFYVGITVKKDNKPLGLLVISDEAEKLITGFAKLEDSPNLNLSLVGKNQKIVASSDLTILGKKVEPQPHKKGLLSLRKEAGGSNYYLFDDSRLAVKIAVSSIDSYMLLDIPEKKIKNLHVERYLYRIAILIALFLVLGGGLCSIAVFRISKPLRELFWVMEQVKLGDHTIRFKSDPIGFEINVLGEHFNDMIEGIVLEQKKRAEEKVKKETYEKELAIGHTIQESLLTATPTDFAIDIATEYTSAKEVGGDFYDLFVVDDETLYLSIADVSGKGISACLYSLGLRSALRSGVSNFSLEKSIIEANELFCADAKDSGMFASLWAAYFNKKTGELSYVNAGHWPAILHSKNGKITLLDTKDIVLGVEKMTKIDVQKVVLQKGDTLVVYSDGLVEMRNPAGKYYGKNRLIQTISLASKTSSEAVMEMLRQDFSQFKQGKKNEDDITVLVLQL